MHEQIKAKLQQGPPLKLDDAERAHLRERLREAVAVALARPAEEIRDDALLFDGLGMDSIDVFDVLDQLAESFEVQVQLDALSPDLLRGEQTTFADFVDGIVDYLEHPRPGT